MFFLTARLTDVLTTKAIQIKGKVAVGTAIVPISLIFILP